MGVGHHRAGDSIPHNVRPAGHQAPGLHVSVPDHEHPAQRQPRVIHQGRPGALHCPAAICATARHVPTRPPGQSVRPVQPRFRQGPQQALPAQGDHRRARAKHQPQVHLSRSQPAAHSATGRARLGRMYLQERHHRGPDRLVRSTSPGKLSSILGKTYNFYKTLQ